MSRDVPIICLGHDGCEVVLAAMKCGPISHALYCTHKLGPFVVTRRVGLVSHVSWLIVSVPRGGQNQMQYPRGMTGVFPGVQSQYCGTDIYGDLDIEQV